VPDLLFGHQGRRRRRRRRRRRKITDIWYLGSAPIITKRSRLVFGSSPMAKWFQGWRYQRRVSILILRGRGP